ncbi:M15 family metallopeptidase [Oleiharenicola sp. Vm1]|uniref:M15 family metallopeptidase n=1 Tax=Oleiharenicola sp. Vm1 TaxID=3398393 RepID=UPI0039F5DB44
MAKGRYARLWARLGIPADYPRTRGLPLQREAPRLVLVARAPDDGKAIRLAPRAAAAWRRMQAAAAADGVTLLPLSGFRSVARQTAIIRGHLARGRPLADLLRYVAAPGCSEHHTGRAIDIGSPDERAHFEASFDRTREFRWLRRHAGRFGFRLSYPRRNPHRIGYEPWHWFFVGRLARR